MVQTAARISRNMLKVLTPVYTSAELTRWSDSLHLNDNHFRLTKGRTKARQRKMHQIARLLELPGNVGPSCPSPPSLNLHSLRKEAAAQSEFEICLGRPRSPIESAIRVHVFSPTLGRSSAQSPSTSPSLSPPPSHPAISVSLSPFRRFESNDHGSQRNLFPANGSAAASRLPRA